LKEQGAGNPTAYAAHGQDWELAKKVIDQCKIRWAIGTFKPFKSARTDRIVPALLQKFDYSSVPYLCQCA
jgi:hypothetical protein